ncbi:MAG: hypothetical protein KAS57_09940 [Gammaproteobacteria bacterium]|nr:hypothetical protein [Gammaproteobacteria bacterium]
MSELSQNFHNKAREAGIERRKLIVTLSTGALGIFFLTLTSEKPEPALTPTQQFLVLTSLVGFAVSVLSGVLAWRADAGRFYFAAKRLEEEDENSKLELKRKGDLWKITKKWATRLLYIGFFIGIITATIFTANRL